MPRLARSLMRTMRSLSKSRGHPPPTIKYEWLLSLLKNQTHCVATGFRFNYSGEIRNPLAPSLDRIDNARGYDPDNVRLVCWRVNRMRSNMSVNDFIDLCCAVAAKNGMVKIKDT